MMKEQIANDFDNNRQEIKWHKAHKLPHQEYDESLKALKAIRRYVTAHQKTHDKVAFYDFLAIERDRSKYGSGEWKMFNEYMSMIGRM